MDLFAAYAVDESLENNGTWFPVGGGTEFLVARSGNKAYGKHLTKLVERDRMVLDLGEEVASAKSDEIMVEVMAHTLLLGWRTAKADGTYDDTIQFKKQALKYSPENAKLILSDPRMKDLRKLVIRCAEDTEAYKLKLEEIQGEA